MISNLTTKNIIMILNTVYQEIKRIIDEGVYGEVDIPLNNLEIPVGHMNDEEKAIFSLLIKSEEEAVKNFLNKRLKNSFRRFGDANYFVRQNFIVVTELDIYSLKWHIYLPHQN